MGLVQAQYEKNHAWDGVFRLADSWPENIWANLSTKFIFKIKIINIEILKKK